MGLFDSRRILVVDDEPSMHADFRRVLGEPVTALADERLDSIEATLFGSKPVSAKVRFDLTAAMQGDAALELARRAMEADSPFAVAFVDMRMPPGWDGLRTTKALWSLDPRLQVVICTAYADYSWDSALEQLDAKDRLLIVKKPFDPVEVWQAAVALSSKWRFAREMEDRITVLEQSLAQCEVALHARAQSPGPQRQ